MALISSNAAPDPAFWRGKRVFVTGHTGFKGSWLCLWLQQLGAELHGYALAPDTAPSLFDSAQVGASMQSQFADVRDHATLTSALSQFQPEIVLHLAAQPLVRLSYLQPRETYETNVMGTVNVLDAVRHTPSVRAVVVVTSDKCYENRELGADHRGYVESDPMGGYDPYSNSKGCAELVTRAFERSYFSSADSHCAVASGRAGNVIGGGDWCADRLVPDFARAMAAGQVLRVRNPHATRPWQHVLEPLSGYLRLAEALFSEGQRAAGAYNFGPSESAARPVSWIADQLASLSGGRIKWEHVGAATDSAPHEAQYLMLDSTKAFETLAWRAALSSEQAIEWTYAWYHEAAPHNWQNARELTLAQIERYRTISRERAHSMSAAK